MLGVIFYQKGQHATAVDLIDRAIAINPDLLAAHFNRGAILQGLRCQEEALVSYDRAVQLKPDYAEAFYNRGNALFDLKRVGEALASYDRAVELNPDYAEAFNNRGTMLRILNRPDEALASYDRAVQLKPDYAEAFYNRGNALLDLKRVDEALASYDRAIEIKPVYEEALYNRANALLDLDRLDDALASYDRALQLRPDYVQALYNRGNLLLDLKRLDEALASYDRVIELEPDSGQAFNCRGNALFALRRIEEALASYDRAIEINPVYEEALYNRANALLDLERLDDALASYDRALQLKPDFPEAHYNRGLVLRDLKRLNEAHESFERALQLKPDFAPAGYTRGTIELLRDRYREGSVKAEASPTKRPTIPKINTPIWLGENLTGCKPQLALESNQNAQVIVNDGCRSNPDQTLMQIHVVNMRRRKDRYEQFLAWNDRKGRFFLFFDAVEGSQELRLDLVAQGLLMDPANLFTLGMLGCAMSHRTLWNQCVSTGKNYLIIEDDACLRSDFSEMLNPVISAAGNEWDMIYLGYNTDATIALICEDGTISPIAFNDSIKAQSDFFNHYSKHAYANELPLVARCCQIWGLLAYIVSPVGASKLCQSCFPLNSNNVIEMLGEGRSIWASSTDGMVNLAMRRDILAFCCLPPLVLGPNDQSDSDTRHRDCRTD